MNRLLSRRAALVLCVGAALSGCGRKSAPKPPDDADPRAPRIYPVDPRLPRGAPRPEPAGTPEPTEAERNPFLYR